MVKYILEIQRKVNMKKNWSQILVNLSYRFQTGNFGLVLHFLFLPLNTLDAVRLQDFVLQFAQINI